MQAGWMHARRWGFENRAKTGIGERAKLAGPLALEAGGEGRNGAVGGGTRASLVERGRVSRVIWSHIGAEVEEATAPPDGAGGCSERNPAVRGRRAGAWAEGMFRLGVGA